MTTPPGLEPSRLPALMLGVGFGAFFDGIVIHQILQWHHMVSGTHDHPVTTVAGLEANTFADGLFHVGAYAIALAGTLMMMSAWHSGRHAPTWRFQIGLMLAGWGMFNVVEGVVDHQILGIHHVRDDLGGPLSWDIGFLIGSALLVFVGLALHASGRRTTQAPGVGNATSGNRQR